MRRLTGSLSKTFIGLILFAGTMGLALWVIGQVASLAGRIPGGGIVATGASRYRQFATTGS